MTVDKSIATIASRYFPNKVRGESIDPEQLVVEAAFSVHYDDKHFGRVSFWSLEMNSIGAFGNEGQWTGAEKKTARRAFDQALERNLAAIMADAKHRMAKVQEPSDLWELETYLTESRKSVDRVYQFRYSHLLTVFSILMRDGWLKEEDLVGLQADKITSIKRGAVVFQ